MGASLPGWAEELKERYLAGESSMFLLHGNTRDVFPWTEDDGSVRHVGLREFLERYLNKFKKKALANEDTCIYSTKTHASTHSFNSSYALIITLATLL